ERREPRAEARACARRRELFAQARESRARRGCVRVRQVYEQRRRAVEGDRVEASKVEFQKRVRGLNRTRAPRLSLAPSPDSYALILNLKQRDRPDSAASRVRADRVEEEYEVVYLASLVGERGRVATPGCR